MYITKFALKNIMRSKGRNILIGIIVIIIAFAVCISLCIRQAAEEAKAETLEDINITAQISPDREKAMEGAMAGGMPGEFDKDALSEMMGEALSLKELKAYAEADSVKSFYYTMTAYMNGSDDFEAYSTGDDSGGSMGFPGGMGGSFESGDFAVTGFSSDEAMTEFVDGTCEITDGAVFEENTSKKVCIIPDELAEFNGLEVGDKIAVTTVDDEEEQYKLKIVGIYSNSQASAQAMGRGGFGGGMSDPANNIYMSYAALEDMVSGSDNIDGTINGTYVLGTMEAYESFQEEVEELGLSDEYVVSSTDLNAYEMMTGSLDSLAKFTGYFLIVVLAVGAVIMIVLNIFATRERKYEIGVLTAIGMKKKKVARLFLTEILIVTLAGVVIGGGIGAATSVPVADAMMNIVNQQDAGRNEGQSFGREFNAPPDMSEGAMQGNMPGGNMSGGGNPADAPGMFGGFGGQGGVMPEGMADFMTDITASVDVTVLLEMMGICLLLALAAGMVSVVAIMRYEPLQILANRD